MVVKILLILIQSLIEICLLGMKHIEQTGVSDSAGIPLDKDYNILGFFLASLRSILKVYEDEKQND